METNTPEQAYHPNQSEGASGPGCFIDQHRICGPDCMAYLPQKPEGKAYIGEQWAHCHLLVNADRAGRHIVILTDMLNRRGREAAATQVRSQTPPGVR
jgi:hypothetical protein